MERSHYFTPGHRVIYIHDTTADVLFDIVAHRPIQIIVVGGGGRAHIVLEVVRFLSTYKNKLIVKSAYSAGVYFALSKKADITEMLACQTHAPSARTKGGALMEMRSIFFDVERFSAYLDETKMLQVRKVMEENFRDKPAEFWQELHPTEYWIDLMHVFRPDNYVQSKPWPNIFFSDSSQK